MRHILSGFDLNAHESLGILKLARKIKEKPGRYSESLRGKTLLMFFETCAVDHGGRMDIQHMNTSDFEIAERWNDTMFVHFGQVASKDIKGPGQHLTHWCLLSDSAWETVAGLRRERADEEVSAVHLDWVQPGGCRRADRGVLNLERRP